MIDFREGLGFTARVLDAIAVRSKVALHNIANQSTPGFKRYEVKFESLLRAAYERGVPAANVHPTVVRDRSGVAGQNNVSVMHELAVLEKTRLLHELFARRAGGYFAHLNKAIRGRV